MKIVRYKKNDLPYNIGDIAGHPDVVADKLIAKGFATLHKDGKPEPMKLLPIAERQSMPTKPASAPAA